MSRRHTLARVLVVAVGILGLVGTGWGADPPKKIYNIEYYLTTPPGSADNFWIPVAKALGYFAQEGIDVTPITAAGAGVAVSAGQGDVAITAPVILVSAAASANPLDLVIIYPWARRLHTELAVPVDSPIKTVKDMKGARIATHSFQQSQYVAAKAALRMNGIDPDKEVKFFSIPAGAPMVNAVQRKEIDVIASFDTQLAQMVNLGLQVRHLELPPATRKAFGSAFAVRREYITQHPGRIIGFGRAIAKATVFTQANPEAATRLLWKYFPDSKPKDVPEDRALQMSLRAVKSRLDNAVVAPSDEVQQYGYVPLSGFEAWLEIDPQWKPKAGDLRRFLDNRFVDEYNRFDAEEIVRQARGFKG